MWTSPRETIRKVVDENPKKHFLWLATLYGLQTMLYFANYLSLGEKHGFGMIFLICLILSPFIGTILLYIYSAALYLSGKWLGGKAPFKHILSAYAWSIIPLIINLILWVLLILFAFDHVFIQYTTGIPFLLLNIVSIITGIWVFVLLIQCVREIQQFTLGRSIGCVILGYVIGFIFFLAVALILSLAAGASS